MTTTDGEARYERTRAEVRADKSDPILGVVRTLAEDHMDVEPGLANDILNALGDADGVCPHMRSRTWRHCSGCGTVLGRGTAKPKAGPKDERGPWLVLSPEGKPSISWAKYHPRDHYPAGATIVPARQAALAGRLVECLRYLHNLYLPHSASDSAWEETRALLAEAEGES